MQMEEGKEFKKNWTSCLGQNLSIININGHALNSNHPFTLTRPWSTPYPHVSLFPP